MPDQPTAAAPESKKSEGPGGQPVGVLGIILMTVYLILFSVLLVWGIVELWPRSSIQEKATGSSPKPSTPAASIKESSSTAAPSVTLFCVTISDSEEVRLILIVVLAGALGGLIHALRSFFWYVGNRDLVYSWLLMYILLPFVGATLALVFDFVIRGGFFSPQATPEQTSPYGFAAVASLVGLFSGQALLKLKEVADTLFTKPEPGENAKPQETSKPTK